MSSETFLATFGLIGLRLVERHGIDPQRFARELGFASTAIPDAKTRLPSELGDIGFEKAMALIPEPAFALRAAECWHPSHLGTLGYAWLSSGSLRRKRSMPSAAMAPWPMAVVSRCGRTTSPPTNMPVCPCTW